MPEVWTHDNLSRHFMPRSDTMLQLFILLCSIVSFMFLFNWRRKITDFLEDQQISLEKSRYEANCVDHSAKVQVKRHICFFPLQQQVTAQQQMTDSYHMHSFTNLTLMPTILPIATKTFATVRRLQFNLRYFSWVEVNYSTKIFLQLSPLQTFL